MTRDWRDNLIGLTLASLSIFAFAQCSNSNSTSKTLVFKSIPDPAIVIESDYSFSRVTSTGTISEKRKGPWTLWNFEVHNTTTATITIFAIHYEAAVGAKKFKGDVTGADASPQTDVLFTLDPDEVATYSAVITDLPARVESNALNYYLRGKAIGWYGTPEAPEKSFKSSFTFRASE
jgi:hypothetical protein